MLARLISLFAICVVTSCVLPQHRTVATVINSAIVASGVGAAIAVANEDHHGDLLDLRPAFYASAASVITAGVFGELLTLALHDHDANPQVRRGPVQAEPW
jgi:hypothetical protein